MRDLLKINYVCRARETNKPTNKLFNSLSMQNVQPVSLVVFTNLSLVQLMWLFKKKKKPLLRKWVLQSCG